MFGANKAAKEVKAAIEVTIEGLCEELEKTRAKLTEVEQVVVERKRLRAIAEYRRKRIRNTELVALNMTDAFTEQHDRAEKAESALSAALEEMERLTRENFNLADRIQSGGIRVQLLTDQLATAEQDRDRLAARIKRLHYALKVAGARIGATQGQLAAAQEKNKRLEVERDRLAARLAIAEKDRFELVAEIERWKDTATPLHYCIGGWTKHLCGEPATADTQSTTAWENVTCLSCLRAQLAAAQQSAKEQRRAGMEHLFSVVQTEVRALRQELNTAYSGPRFQQMLNAIREAAKEEGE